MAHIKSPKFSFLIHLVLLLLGNIFRTEATYVTPPVHCHGLVPKITQGEFIFHDNESYNLRLTTNVKLQLDQHHRSCFQVDIEAKTQTSTQKSDLKSGPKAAANSTTKKHPIESLFYAVEYASFEEHYPIRSHYTFGIPVFRSYCKCDCPGGDSICDHTFGPKFCEPGWEKSAGDFGNMENSHSAFDDIVTAQQRRAETICVKKFHVNQDSAGCPGSQTEPSNLCCYVTVRPWESRRFIAITLSQPVPTIKLVISIYALVRDQQKWVLFRQYHRNILPYKGNYLHLNGFENVADMFIFADANNARFGLTKHGYYFEQRRADADAEPIIQHNDVNFQNIDKFEEQKFDTRKPTTPNNNEGPNAPTKTQSLFKPTAQLPIDDEATSINQTLRRASKPPTNPDRTTVTSKLSSQLPKAKRGIVPPPFELIESAEIVNGPHEHSVQKLGWLRFDESSGNWRIANALVDLSLIHQPIVTNCVAQAYIDRYDVNVEFLVIQNRSGALSSNRPFVGYSVKDRERFIQDISLVTRREQEYGGNQGYGSYRAPTPVEVRVVHRAASAPTLKLDLSLRQKLNIISHLHASYVRDFHAKIQVDKYGNRYLNATLIEASGQFLLQLYRNSPQVQNSDGDLKFSPGNFPGAVDIVLSLVTNLPFVLNYTEILPLPGYIRSRRRVCIQPLQKPKSQLCKLASYEEDPVTWFALASTFIPNEGNCPGCNEGFNTGTSGFFSGFLENLNPGNWFNGINSFSEGVALTFEVLVWAFFGLLVFVLLRKVICPLFLWALRSSRRRGSKEDRICISKQDLKSVLVEVNKANKSAAYDNGNSV